MSRDVSNTADLIDSRDVIARIEELQEELEDRGLTTEGDETPLEDLREELRQLLKLQEQAEGYCDWQYGAGLIRDSYFETYAREYADDIGAINADAGWPNNCIDWTRATRELQMDYTQVDFDGVAYWIGR